MMRAVQNAVAAQQAALGFQIDMAVVKKSLENAEVQGQAVQQLLEQAVRLSKAIGAGENFDAVV